MLPLPEGIEAKDVSQWIGSGVSLYRNPKGELEPVTLSGWMPEVHDDGIHLKLTSLKHHGISYGPFTLNGPREGGGTHQVFCHWPICGSLNIPSYKGAIFLQRQQKKQFTRTYNTHCAKVMHVDPNHPKRNDMFPMLGSGSKEVILAAFEPEYFSFVEGMDRGTYHDWSSFAINPHVIVSVRRMPRVYFDGEFVGQIKDGVLETFDPAMKRRIVGAFEGYVE